MLEIPTDLLWILLASMAGSFYGHFIMNLGDRLRTKRIEKKKLKPKANESNTPTKKTKKSLPFLKPKEKKEPSIKYVKGEKE